MGLRPGYLRHPDVARGGLGFGVWGLGFGVWGFRVQGFGLRVHEAGGPPASQFLAHCKLVNKSTSIGTLGAR